MRTRQGHQEKTMDRHLGFAVGEEPTRNLSPAFYPPRSQYGGSHSFRQPPRKLYNTAQQEPRYYSPPSASRRQTVTEAKRTLFFVSSDDNDEAVRIEEYGPRKSVSTLA